MKYSYPIGQWLYSKHVMFFAEYSYPYLVILDYAITLTLTLNAKVAVLVHVSKHVQSIVCLLVLILYVQFNIF